MHDALKEVERKVIPRWRRLADTPSAELSGAGNNKLRPLNVSQEVRDVLSAFEGDKSIHHAIEALYLKGMCSDELLQEPAKLVLGHDGLKPSVYGIANAVMFGQGGAQKNFGAPNPTRLITSLRNHLKENPRNALAHVELARSFASVGMGDKAHRHFRVALQLAPNNRFILRAAGRFFVHQKNEGSAIKAMKEAARYDPWVAASAISIAQLAKAPMPRTRELTSLIERVDDPAETSELSAALATAELESGNVKRAKKLFRASAIAPTDNVVAQLEWASNRHGIGFDERLLESSLAFEARAARHARSHEWIKFVDACDLWMADEPFSVRPAYEGGFVASEMLQDYRRAKTFVERGLVANPHDSLLLNNLAFHQAMLGEYPQAWKTIAQARKATDAERLVAIDATEGLLNYRTGSPETGAKLYEAAIRKADALGLRKSKQLAFIHFAYEETRRGANFPEEDIRRIVAFFDGPRVDKQIRAIFDSFLKPMFLAHEWVNVTVPSFLRESLQSFANDPVLIGSPTEPPEPSNLPM